MSKTNSVFVESQPAQSALTENDRVVFVQGTSGFIKFGFRHIQRGLKKAGYNAPVDYHYWHKPRPPSFPIVSHREYELVHEGAQALVDKIISHVSTPPARVYLVGQSAGCEVIRLALELLPRSVCVENVVLCGPSISPDADWSDALRVMKGRVYYQCSLLDSILLVFGTALVGTTDRKYGVSAGVVGFVEPRSLDEKARRIYRSKLVEVRWRPSFALRGYFGDHMSQQSVGHVKNNISRMLAGTWDAKPYWPSNLIQKGVTDPRLKLTNRGIFFVKFRRKRCAAAIKRLTRGLKSNDLHKRCKSIVRMRSYSSADADSRNEVRRLLIEAIGDSDFSVRSLAALGLIAYKEDNDARDAVSRALEDTSFPPEQEILADILSRFNNTSQ